MYGFEAVIFKGKRTAGKALDTLADRAGPPMAGSTTSLKCPVASSASSVSTALGRRTTAPSVREPDGEWSPAPCSAFWRVRAAR